MIHQIVDQYISTLTYAGDDLASPLGLLFLGCLSLELLAVVWIGLLLPLLLVQAFLQGIDVYNDACHLRLFLKIPTILHVCHDMSLPTSLSAEYSLPWNFVMGALAGV